MTLNIGLNNWFSRALAAIIAMLASAGCGSAGKISKDGPGNEPKCVYGVPMAYYKVHGTVTDTKNNPIEGVQVEVEVSRKDDNGAPLESYDYNLIYAEPATTDQNGEYQYSGVEKFGGRVIKVKFTDPSGKFKPDTVFTRTPIKDETAKWKSYYEYEVNTTLEPVK